MLAQGGDSEGKVSILVIVTAIVKKKTFNITILLRLPSKTTEILPCFI
jgi:hypothetical protein